MEAGRIEFQNAMQLAGAEYEFCDVLLSAAIAARNKLTQRIFQQFAMMGAERLSDIRLVVTADRLERFYYGPCFFELRWQFAGIGSPGDFGVEGNARGPSMMRVYAVPGCDDE